VYNTMLTSLGSIPRVPTYHRLLLCHLMSGDSWTTWPRLTDCQVSNSHIKDLRLHFLYIPFPLTKHTHILPTLPSNADTSSYFSHTQIPLKTLFKLFYNHIVSLIIIFTTPLQITHNQSVYKFFQPISSMLPTMIY